VLVLAHSEEQGATATWKKTFGHHPLMAFVDHGSGGSGEPVAGPLRPGNAGSDTTAGSVEPGTHPTRRPAHQPDHDCPEQPKRPVKKPLGRIRCAPKLFLCTDPYARLHVSSLRYPQEPETAT
jgi:hypothetical protein